MSEIVSSPFIKVIMPFSPNKSSRFTSDPKYVVLSLKLIFVYSVSTVSGVT